ncbi:transcobalamin-1-like [Malaclemys terrapin pileata]|uniref:transcobalamin-1-like n=1 Tax=Malaclemys terrapin pileata TaxID=2991368 RepID=UPI0023A8BC0B|nr:transcobalamin-1-like [Malaclemys terrapin pileata]
MDPDSKSNWRLTWALQKGCRWVQRQKIHPHRQNVVSTRQGSLPTSHPTNISVIYTAADHVNQSFSDSIRVTVPQGSFFFDVMEVAQKRYPRRFRFTYTLCVWGAYITSVWGLQADNNQRTYWQLLSNGILLKLGAGCYAVSHRERLEVRFSTY